MEIPTMPTHRVQVATLVVWFRVFCYAGLMGVTLESSGRLGKRMERKEEKENGQGAWLEEKTLAFNNPVTEWFSPFQILKNIP